MLKLKSLKFNNIGRFVEEQTIDFSLLGNINQVDAINSNTGGSSGSGKSTVFNSLDYLFGLNSVPNSVLQSRLTKEPISVIGTFDFDGKNLEITRSKKGLRVDLEGIVIEGSAKLAEEKLDEIIGISRDLFRKMLHKRQKEGGFFLELTPKETHSFLTDSLGLSYLSNKMEIIDLDIKTLSQKREQAENNIRNTASVLQGLEGTMSSLVLPDSPRHTQAELIELERVLSGSVESYKDLVKSNNEKKEKFLSTRPVTTVDPYDQSILKELQIKKADIENQIRNVTLSHNEKKNSIKEKISAQVLSLNQIESKIKDSIRIAQQIEKDVAEVKKIRASMCPTCEQHWNTTTAKLREKELLLSISSNKELANTSTFLSQKCGFEAEILKLKIELETPINSEEIKILESQLSALSSSIAEEADKSNAHLSVQNAKNKELMNIFYKNQSELEQILNNSLMLKSKEVEINKELHDKVVVELNNYRSNMERYNTSIDNLKKNKESYLTQLDLLNSEIAALTGKLLIAEEVRRAIKTYTSCSFDDALASISENATKIIRSIPNMSNATILLEGIKETKDGKIKEEVTAIISSDGELEIPIKSLSGGERSSIDLAIDLAVIDMLEAKTNKGIDVFILDEPFTGLDTVSIEMALEVLKNSNLNKKLVLVDHNPVIKDLVDNRIMVIRNGLESRVEQ